MSGFVVAHPGLQHAHQLAWALHERGVLQAFWSGVPVVAEGEHPPFWLPEPYAAKVKTANVPARLRRHPIVFQALLRAGNLSRDPARRHDRQHRVFHAFDRWAAARVRASRPKAVVAFENSAYLTFQAAKAVGARCVLDAPSLHRSAGAAMGAVPQTAYLREIERRKDAETSLADLVLTCSPLAAESYVAAGLDQAKVRAVLLGATLPPGVPAWSPSAGPVRFVFAGSLRRIKGLDALLAVFERLQRAAVPFRLTVAGGEGEPGWVERIRALQGAEYLGALPQRELYRRFAEADCLVLPSLMDSFGMVVAEAMAAGTPAVVSTRAGARAIIDQFPGAGWVTKPDVESLLQAIQARIDDRAGLAAARARAREAAASFTWAAYRERVGALLTDWVQA